MPEEKDLTSGRYTISKLKMYEMCDSILEKLEKAISLKEDGLILESDAVMDMDRREKFGSGSYAGSRIKSESGRL